MSTHGCRSLNCCCASLTSASPKNNRMRIVLLFFCFLCISQACRPRLKENVDFAGSNIQSLYSPDAKHCQHLCTQHPACQHFTFVRTDSSNENSHFLCYLKSGHQSKKNREGVTSGHSLKACSPDLAPCLPQVYEGVDFYGTDYQTLFTSDYGGCQRVCTNDPHCQFFTFFNGSFETAEYRYKCHLKFSWTVPRSPWMKKKANLLSGYSHKIINSQPDTACKVKLFSDVEIVGNLTESLLASSPFHCHALCSAHPQCSFFVYISNEFICELRNDPNQMVVKAKDGVVSGIPARSCQHGSWVETINRGVDYWGSDLSDLRADNVEECQRACTKDPLCQFFTYVHRSFLTTRLRKICYLKRTITLPAPVKVSKLANAVSGFSLRNCVSSTNPVQTPAVEVEVPEMFT